MDFRAPTTFRLSLFLLFFWGSVIAIEGFMVPYLASIGFTEQQSGLVMAAIFLVTVGSAPLWGYIADRTDRHRRIIVMSVAVGIGAVILIAASGSAIRLIVLFALIYSLTTNSMPALIDSWIMKLSRAGAPISYGIARGFGSAGFALTGAILGVVLERHGLILLFPIYAGMALIVILLAATTRVPRSETGSEAGTTPSSAATPDASHPVTEVLRAIFTNGRYLTFLVATFFALLGTRAALTFLPLRLYSLGGTTVHVGWSQSIYAASEIPFMFLTVYLLRRMKPRPVIMAGMVFFVVRLVLTRLAPTPGALLAVQAVHGGSMGLLLPASVHYIDRIAPPQFRSLFQTLAPSIYFGLASVVGSALGGAIIGRFGLDVLYTVAPMASAVGVVLFAGSFFIHTRGTRQEETLPA